MRGVNKVILLGHLGADPEIRVFEGGDKIATVRLATNRSYTTREGDRIEETEWHRIVFRSKLADIAEQYLKKGNGLYVEGRLKTRQWKDKDGNDRYTTEVIANEMQFIDRREDGSSGAAPVSQTATQAPSSDSASFSSDSQIPENDGDDLPF